MRPLFISTMRDSVSQFQSSAAQCLIPLRHGGAAVLQKPLHKRDIITVISVNLRGVPFSEAVSADAVIAEISTNGGKLLLH